ncbi:hypothetical protein EJB05_03745 [Eragrostis curvula]|uniref:Nucleolar protein 58/56 N-terminal domain-containing protein n=1 Tax=Eragrostis curvula TaxID=38414 RepID=A0A5J9W7F2_9POAL|nr:hypothetical protein EJB05_03307 [Eragrostis curvula]TVU44309.1 hypothetical protein EJB05_03745 [Eragrostis curvula]
MEESRKRRRCHPPRLSPPPPPRGSLLVDFVKWLRHGGVVLVLFETPSGFALLSFNGIELFRENALENIWADFVMESDAEMIVSLREFQNFEDKANAIKHDTGVSDQLANMIRKHVHPEMKLVVGKLEHKEIIEASLSIYCLFDEVVMEVMWGLKNLMKSLVPEEKLELPKEDRLLMSYGMKIVLDRHGFNVKPEMVNRDIIEMAGALHSCDSCMDHHAAFLRRGHEQLEKVSGMNSQNWDSLKVATALKLICYPEEEVDVTLTPDSREVLSVYEARKLMTDAPLYESKLDKRACLITYKQIRHSHGIRIKALGALRFFVKQAKEACEAEEVVWKPQVDGEPTDMSAV